MQMPRDKQRKGNIPAGGKHTSFMKKKKTTPEIDMDSWRKPPPGTVASVLGTPGALYTQASSDNATA